MSEWTATNTARRLAAGSLRFHDKEELGPVHGWLSARRGRDGAIRVPAQSIVALKLDRLSQGGARYDKRMAAVLSPELRRQLDLIEPSVFLPGVSLYPCSAKLRDETLIECVYFVTAAAFKRLWGRETPEEVPGQRGISPDQVASVRESPYRLPARFANEIYRAGESGYGYHDFTLAFSFWCRRDYVVGGLVDFLYYPRWHGPTDVKRVVLYLNRRRPRPQPETFWCVYATADG